MGLLDLFKKKTGPTSAPPSRPAAAPYTADMVQAVLKELYLRTRQPVIRLALTGDTPALAASKLGGLPYLPPGAAVPTTAAGQQLTLLAQIRCEELPANSLYPPAGLVQFYILNDDLLGLQNFDALDDQSASRVLFWPRVDLAVTAEQVRPRYRPYGEEDDYFPFTGCFGLRFSLEEEGMSSCDHRFDAAFCALWASFYPQVPLAHWYDLPDALTEDPFNDLSGFGHKLGGYPAFTQEDPRDCHGRYAPYSQLLLQIDSAGLGSREIMWGDSGVAGFFAPAGALAAGDTSRILYNWDCF